MSETMQRYKILLERIIQGRDGGSEEQEDTLLEEMDDLWWKLTKEEREALALDAPPEVDG